MAHLAHDFLQIRACSEALLLEASDFRFLTEQMLIEKLDAAALVRALGLKQRILEAAWKAAALRRRPVMEGGPCPLFVSTFSPP